MASMLLTHALFDSSQLFLEFVPIGFEASPLRMRQPPNGLRRQTFFLQF